MITKAPRGTADILPSGVYKWHYVEKITTETARIFGFSEIRTPVFEHTELFLRGVGDTTDVVQKEMYTFSDKGDRSITLRPEGTASAARAYLEHSLFASGGITKLFYNIACYRYEKPQAGRMREFHQFGAEVYGCQNPSCDAEVIAFVHTVLCNLGIKDIKLNINSIGCPKCRAEYSKALIEYLKGGYDSLCETCHNRLEKNPMRVLDCKCPSCKEVSKGAPSILEYICPECREHFESVQSYLTDMEIDFSIDPSIVRGLDYYTKTVFEFVSDSIGAQGTICGGGRYDNLIEELGGSPTPGIGFAMGIERIILVMEAQGVDIPKAPVPDIFIASIGQDSFVQKFTYELRKCGIHAECDHQGRSLKAQMKYANKSGARFVIAVGEDEVIKGIVKIKNMTDSFETELSLNANEIADYLGGNRE